MNDLHNTIFTNLKAIGVHEIKRYKSARNEQTKVYWVCECRCGNTKIVRGEHLTSGRTISCGCLAKDNATRHGNARRTGYTSEYRSWLFMRGRIINPDEHHKKYYDGISYAYEWEDFKKFLSDMGKKPSPQHELDRIDPYLPYCKENCRWATRHEQMVNQRRHYK